MHKKIELNKHELTNNKNCQTATPSANQPIELDLDIQSISEVMSDYSTSPPLPTTTSNTQTGLNNASSSLENTHINFPNVLTSSPPTLASFLAQIPPPNQQTNSQIESNTCYATPEASNNAGSAPPMPNGPQISSDNNMDTTDAMSDDLEQDPLEGPWNWHINQDRMDQVKPTPTMSIDRLLGEIKSPQFAILTARKFLILAAHLEEDHHTQTMYLNFLQEFRDLTEASGRPSDATEPLNKCQSNSQSASSPSHLFSSPLAEKSATPLPGSNHGKEGSSQADTANQDAYRCPERAPKASYSEVLQSKSSDVKKPSSQKRTTPHKPRPAPTVSKRLVLTPATKSTLPDALTLRNNLNNAFLASKLSLKPVVASVHLTKSQNIVLTCTEDFSTSFLEQNASVIAAIIPFTSIAPDLKWFQVVVHHVPTNLFSSTNPKDGMSALRKDVEDHNGISLAGIPFWLSSPSARASKPYGSAVLSFSKVETANRVLNKPFYVAGTKVPTAKYLSTPPTYQCNNCNGYGHQEKFCKRPTVCSLCSGNHHTSAHTCATCPTTGKACPHTSYKCINCSGPHAASSPNCERFKAVKQKAQATPKAASSTPAPFPILSTPTLDEMEL